MVLGPSIILTLGHMERSRVRIIIDSRVGSNRILRGPPIQVVGVALITEFYDHYYSFVEVVFQTRLLRRKSDIIL